MKKMYELGVLVGRFQTIHKGHVEMIEKALALCDTVGVFVGSSQESRTEKNPFSYEEREIMLKAVFGERIYVYPLPDIGVGNNSKWGDYVMKNVKERFGILPDLSVSGKEDRRASWLDSEEGKSVAELYIAKTIDISATQMREFLISDDRENWEKYTDEKLYPMYDSMRKIVISSKDNKNTESI